MTLYSIISTETHVNLYTNDHNTTMFDCSC